MKPDDVSTTRLVGRSAVVEALRLELAAHARHARERFLVIFRGEPGTGKNAAAEELARLAGVGRPRFISVNCAALAPTLFEGQLFGHERGTFTGAVRQMAGLLERAAGGILFLNEIAELCPEFQAKLLDVLESATFCRIGGSHMLDVPWIVCATDRDLEAEVRAGRVRADFYYRVMVHPIYLPPLRERAVDIAPILHELARRRGRELRLDVDAEALLARHPWPGNVRELGSVFERIFLASPVRSSIHATEEAVRCAMVRNGRASIDLPGPKKCPPQIADAEADEDVVAQARSSIRRLVSARHVEEPVLWLEREALVAAYEASGRSLTATAKLLGMNRWTLSRRLADAGVTPRAKPNGR